VPAVIAAIACSSSILSSSLAAQLSMVVLALSLPAAAAATAAPEAPFAFSSSMSEHAHTDSMSAFEATRSPNLLAAATSSSLHRRRLSTSVASWTKLKEAIGSSPSTITLTFAANFNCNYDSQIFISSGDVTIHGGNATCDARLLGRFYEISSGASLALNAMTLKNGRGASGDVSVLCYCCHALHTLQFEVAHSQCPHRKCSKSLPFSQLFFSFLTFLLLFAQWGGAIRNNGTLTVKYGNFTGNSAIQVRNSSS
jgi:hypothetical protein